jgi:ATPase subunit of ABC transporter with duplicated ATPase domains
MINDILSAAETLRTELDKQEEQNAKVDAAKASLLQLMIAAGPACENTLRVQWGQIQRVTKTEWEYRDRGVTAQNKAVEVAEKALAAAKKLLTGLKNAAKSAGKAKVVSESVSLRIVRGDKG